MTVHPVHQAAPFASSRRRRPSAVRWGWRAAAVIVSLALWQAATILLGDTVVPSPGETVVALGQLVATGAFWAAVGATVGSTLVGLAIAIVVAVPLGLLAGSGGFATASTRLSVDFLRTIPPVTLIPLAVLLYGPSAEMQVVLIVFGSVWPLFLQAVYAVREVDPLLRDVSRAFRLSRRSLWVDIVLPSSTPFLLTGLRVASTIALLLAVAAELIGNAPGVGREIALAQLGAQVPTAYAYVVVAALLGVALNLGVAVAQRRMLFWHPSVRTEGR
ncbi:ABC transporter permease [Subtercola sp. YIM 133946]|uniref:ABC transporter permease n=1 Tax=Subtercola sp. YIM 133946 TaxID=3118909 RepID=UPI002F92F92E